MDSTSTPRINCAYLDTYIGRNVMIVGKLMQLRGDEAIVDANGSLTAHLNREAHLAAGNGVQLIGKVQPDLSIKVLSSLDLGTGVDYDITNTVVDLQQSYKNLFSGATN